eukprot:CAMPEP_0174755130 /NCGR_PEP_ID=MMETSP1094-20130205/106092_1 /TAXON_ID=156173 /ORGANISM="Chrysochromulina brevifilum, Strain UTEX LB 985" /LENGTH=54 /DNA_ID=CAMNT_0015961017 /DNA_START=174 /DNA_END=338 /DNA_ORIENTATION=+
MSHARLPPRFVVDMEGSGGIGAHLACMRMERWDVDLADGAEPPPAAPSGPHPPA